MPTLDSFIESLSQEQDKLISMRKINGSKEHALVVHDCSHNPKQISKSKYKGKEHGNPKKKGNTKPFNDSSGPKVKKGRNRINAHTIKEDSF